MPPPGFGSLRLTIGESAVRNKFSNSSTVLLTSAYRSNGNGNRMALHRSKQLLTSMDGMNHNTTNSPKA